MTETTITKLSDELGVEVASDARSARICDITGYSPQPKLVLTEQDAWSFVGYWTDGYCAACETEIPVGHRLCQKCAEEEAEEWGLLR